MTGEVLKVSVATVELRELPDAGAVALTVLPRGQVVRRLDDRLWYGAWLRIETDHGGRRYHGYVPNSSLSADVVAPPPLTLNARVLAGQLEETLKGFGRRSTQLVLTRQRRELIARIAPRLAHSLPLAGVTTRARLAHFVGQTALETGYYGTLTEGASGEAYNPGTNVATRLGNSEPGDGPRFKGRGLMQLTGRRNYARASAALGLGDALVRSPERVASEYALAVDTAIWYWTDRNANRIVDTWPGDLQAVSLAVTRMVNAGDPNSTVKIHGERNRFLLTQSAFAAFASLTS